MATAAINTARTVDTQVSTIGSLSHGGGRAERYVFESGVKPAELTNALNRAVGIAKFPCTAGDIGDCTPQVAIP